MLYYRYTHRNTPMSDWGHAMFCDNDWRNAGDGYCWTLDSALCTPITSLRDIIIETWEYDLANGFTGDFGNNPEHDFYCTAGIGGEDIADSFNPEDISDTADAWDSDLTQWFWERIAEPNGIMAISTQDGAICFDKSWVKAAEVAS